MSLDQTTESIAHFIGLFELAVEEARLRLEYAEFEALRQEDDATDSGDFGPVKLTAPLVPEGFDPSTRPLPTMPEKYASAPPNPAPEPVPDLGPGTSEEPVPGFYDGETVSQIVVQSGIGTIVWVIPGSVTILPFVSTPSSVATITLQTIRLSDNDIVGDPDGAGFLPPAIFEALLVKAIELSQAMTPWTHSHLASEVLADPQVAVDFLQSLEDVALPDIDGVTGLVLRGEDAIVRIVNGEVVDGDLPTRDDLLPAYLKHKHSDPSDDSVTGDDLNAVRDPGMLDLATDAAALPVAQHSVSAGANELTNQAFISTSWIDAGVIAVAGDVVTIDAISQVNVLSNRDTFDGFAMPALDASRSVNAAEIGATASTLQSPYQSVTADLPVTWNVKTIKGDVVLTNLVQQHSFVTDADRLDLTFTAASTKIVAGENQAFNVAVLQELGFGYDAIFVGGSMATTNLISQVNVLLDNDAFGGPGLDGVAISGGDNLAFNKAEILREGVDEHIEMAQAFGDALKSFAKGAAELAADVARDDIFAGFEALRVLYIEGNLTQMNLVEQVNYLGDQDQVHMAADAMKSMLEDAAVSIRTGANALANEARIATSGLDSKIMAGGQVYDTAMLYQAELIDEDAMPSGVSIKALATEAVAFLADDMLMPSMSDMFEDAGITTDSHAGSTSLDVMQTMTA
jgi:hypothetical protein